MDSSLINPPSLIGNAPQVASQGWVSPNATSLESARGASHGIVGASLASSYVDSGAGLTEHGVGSSCAGTEVDSSLASIRCRVAAVDWAHWDPKPVYERIYRQVLEVFGTPGSLEQLRIRERLFSSFEEAQRLFLAATVEQDMGLYLNQVVRLLLIGWRRDFEANLTLELDCHAQGGPSRETAASACGMVALFEEERLFLQKLYRGKVSSALQATALCSEYEALRARFDRGCMTSSSDSSSSFVGLVRMAVIGQGVVDACGL